MAKKTTFIYYNFSDRLFISKKSERDIIDGSVRILDVILDFDKEGKVANIELVDASQYLGSLDINPKILNKLNYADFSIKELRNGYVIIFLLKSGREFIRFPYSIHMPTRKQVPIAS